MSFAAAEGDRRISQLIQIGEITEVNGDGTARVQVGELVTAQVPVTVFRAGGMVTWWMPTVGEQVVLACPSGDVARAVVLGSVAAGNAPSSDVGEPMFHLGGGRMVIVGDLKVDGDLEVTGNVQVGGDVNVDGDAVIGGISFLTHVHGGVVRGGASTDPPSGG